MPVLAVMAGLTSLCVKHEDFGLGLELEPELVKLGKSLIAGPGGAGERWRHGEDHGHDGTDQNDDAYAARPENPRERGTLFSAAASRPLVVHVVHVAIIMAKPAGTGRNVVLLTGPQPSSRFVGEASVAWIRVLRILDFVAFAVSRRLLPFLVLSGFAGFLHHFQLVQGFYFISLTGQRGDISRRLARGIVQ